MRKTKDAIDVDTGEKIYFRSHATQTFMSDGRTVEQAIKSGGGSGGGSYDDTEIQNKLTELSAEVDELSERIDEIGEGAVAITNEEITEIINMVFGGGGYGYYGVGIGIGDWDY